MPPIPERGCQGIRSRRPQSSGALARAQPASDRGSSRPTRSDEAPTIDLERVRADTPGVETVAHFNNAGAALMLRPVLDAVIGHLELGVAERYERVQSLATALRAGLEAIPGVTVADQGLERCGIVTFTVDGTEALDVKDALRAAQIKVNVIEPSNTLLDSRKRDLPDLVRASVHYYNSEAELGRLLDAISVLA